MNKALIYCRVSTEEQANEGLSLEVQKDKGLEKAQALGYEVTDSGVYVDEGKTATNMNRQGLIDMLVATDDNDVKAIIVLDTDRLARNEIDHFSIKHSLKKNNISLISVNQPIDDTPEGLLLDTVLSGVNAFSSRITGRKVSSSMFKKIKMGIWPGWAPPGYSNVDIGTETNPNKIVKINNDLGNIAKEAFILYASETYSVKKLCETMYYKVTL